MNKTIPVKAVSTRSGITLRAVMGRLSLASAIVSSRRAHKNRAIERELGIDTLLRPVAAVTREARFADSVHYEALDYALLRNYLHHLRWSPSDVAFDIGCGAGRMLCELARMPIARAVGVELSPELAALARKNAESLRGRRAQIEVHQADATTADYGAGTIYTLYNPFGSETMAVVLERIRQSLVERPRSVQILYINPVCGNLFEDAPWLRLSAHRRSPWYRAEASYYVNRPQ